MLMAVAALVLLAGSVATYWYTEVRSGSVAPNARPDQSQQIELVQADNAVQKRVSQQLRDYLQWLQDNNVQGYIGEYGWPSGADAAQWSAVAQVWFKQLGSADVWTTAWAAGSKWGPDYPLTIYTAATGTDGLSQSGPQAAALEAFWQSGNRQGLQGINVAGMEFGNNVSATNRGAAGQDYFYEPAQSYAFLAQHGVRLVRIPVLWERLQPKLFGPLDVTEMRAVSAALDAAQANGIQAVVDLHNYGAYADDKSQLKLGSSGLSADALSNFWGAMTQQVGTHPALAGYSIMNEPHDLWPGSKPADAAKKWESLTQQIVTSLRAAGFDGTICVPGYDWSSLARWRGNHPAAWIKDPKNNVRYEAHHYWDTDGSGRYAASFADELRE